MNFIYNAPVPVLQKRAQYSTASHNYQAQYIAKKYNGKIRFKKMGKQNKLSSAVIKAHCITASIPPSRNGGTKILRRRRFAAHGMLQFSSVQDGIYALRKARMRSTQSLRSFPNEAFETVQIFV